MKHIRPALIAIVTILVFLGLIVLGNKARGDDFDTYLKALEAKNAKPPAGPVVPAAVPDGIPQRVTAPAGVKTFTHCPCTDPKECTCPNGGPGGASCLCGVCEAKKPVRLESDDPARPWIWENGWDGWGYYRDAAPAACAPGRRS